MTTLGFDVFWRDHGASRGMKNLGDDTHKTSGKFSTFKTVAAGAGLVVGAAIFKLGKDSVKAFTEAETSQTKLQDAFKRFPKLADVTIGSLRNLNTQLALKTKFDDDAFASGQAVLAQFGLTGKELTNITPLLADYAAKTGRDLPRAATTLGKAFFGNTRALKELGIAYKPTGDKAKDMAAIQELLNEKVGGFAENQGKSAAGQAAILANQFGELEETAGSVLVPTLLKLAGALQSVAGFISRNSKVIVPLVEVLGTFVAILFVGVKVIGLINAALALFGVEMTVATGGLNLIIPAIAALVVGLIYAYKHSETFRNIVNGVFRVVGNAALIFAEIVLKVLRGVVTGFLDFAGTIVHAAAVAFGWVPGLGDKLKTADKAFTNFRKGVEDNFGKAVAAVVGWRTTLNNAPKIAKLKGDIKDLQSKLATARRELKDPNLTKERRANLNANIAALQAKIRTAQGNINSLHGKTVTIGVNLALQAVGGNWEVLRGIAGRQHGGPVTAGMPYRVGERGPELFIPKTSGWIQPRVSESLVRVSSQGGGVVNNYITLNAPNYLGSRQELMTTMRNEIRDKGGDVQVVLGARR